MGVLPRDDTEELLQCFLGKTTEVPSSSSSMSSLSLLAVETWEGGHDDGILSPTCPELAGEALERSSNSGFLARVVFRSRRE